jgi:tetratricopeptide (TPR) repeat protein
MSGNTENEPREPDQVDDGGAAGGEGGKDRARFNLEVVGENASEAVAKLKNNVQYWVERGRYNKVRIKRAGKPVLPDIPVGALVAFEAATFFWTGLLRAALVNVVGRAFFEVELINEADEHYRKGVEHFLAGELPDAEQHLEKALRVDARHAKAHLQMGVLRKVQGNRDLAKSHFQRVLELAPRTEPAREAEVHLKKM